MSGSMRVGYADLTCPVCGKQVLDLRADDDGWSAVHLDGRCSLTLEQMRACARLLETE